MRKFCQSLILTYPSLLLTKLWLMPQAIAQVTPDNTLSTKVNSADGANFTIENGDRAGNNLFHSFAEFSIPSNGSATFSNAPEIEHIFSRVTGGNISQIEGAINAAGNANLLLLNPAGIIFGENARLNIGGSFLATTAESLLFEGGEFSAVDVQFQPLLTINRPLGLNFNSRPGSIVNRAGTLVDPAIPPTGLQVAPGKNITLVGGEIQLDGGFIAAPGGAIQLGSLADTGRVSFNSVNQDLILEYERGTNFGDIELANLGRLDTSGLGGGEINLQGQNIILTGGSKIISDTFGDESGGDITIVASDTVQVLGATDIPGFFEPVDAPFGIFVPLQSSISANTTDNGDAGNIAITTGKLELADGAQITTFTTTLSGILAEPPGAGGDITINASEAVLLDGVVPVGGEEDVFGLDRLGVELNGVSSLGTVTVNESKAGNLTINTDKLTVKNGAVITTNSFAEGQGGELSIKATDAVEVTGLSPSGVVSSGIVSASVTTGTAGDVKISSNKTTFRNGGQLIVGNIGTGEAGNLELDTQNLLLDNGVLSAATQAGDRGNISVNNAETISLRNGSQITTNATGLATGGDINLNTEAIAILDKSNITAIAEAGQGGNIQIKTQGLFIDADSEISAASNLGIDGMIAINNPDVDPTSGIVELPSVPIDAEAILAADLCRVENADVARRSSFVITGRGGLTPTSAESLSNINDVVNWADEADLDTGAEGIVAVGRSPISAASQNKTIERAQGITMAADGSLWLSANPTDVTPQDSRQHPNCQTAQFPVPHQNN